MYRIVLLYCIVLKVQHLIKIDNEDCNNWKEKAGGPKQQILLIWSGSGQAIQRKNHRKPGKARK